MLAEKRKKKTKVLYQESELSIQEAVDHTCDSEDRFKKFNVTSVGGRPEYTKVQGKVAKTEYKKQLAGRRPTGLNLKKWASCGAGERPARAGRLPDTHPLWAADLRRRVQACARRC